MNACQAEPIIFARVISAPGACHIYAAAPRNTLESEQKQNSYSKRNKSLPLPSPPSVLTHFQSSIGADICESVLMEKSGKEVGENTQLDFRFVETEPAPELVRFDDEKSWNEVEENHDSFRYTEHGKARAATRNIPEEDIATVLTYGREVYGCGVIVYFVGKKEIKEYGKQIAHCAGIHVLVSPDNGGVVTTYRNNEFHINQPKRNVNRKSSTKYRIALDPAQQKWKRKLAMEAEERAHRKNDYKLAA